MERKPFFVAKDCNSIGLDKVPPKAMVLNKMTGALSLLKNKTGVIGTTKLKDGPIFFSYQPASFNNSCPEVPPFTVSTPTEILILYDFPRDIPGYYIHSQATSLGVTGYKLFGTSIIINPNNHFQAITGKVYTAATPFITGIIAILNPDGTWVENAIVDDEKSVILNEVAVYYIGKTWDRTTIN